MTLIAVTRSTSTAACDRSASTGRDGRFTVDGRWAARIGRRRARWTRTPCRCVLEPRGSRRTGADPSHEVTVTPDPVPADWPSSVGGGAADGRPQRPPALAAAGRRRAGRHGAAARSWRRCPARWSACSSRVGDAVTRPSAARRHRSDEDGKRAPRHARRHVAEIHVRDGQSVEAGALLVVVIAVMDDIRRKDVQVSRRLLSGTTAGCSAARLAPFDDRRRHPGGCDRQHADRRSRARPHARAPSARAPSSLKSARSYRRAVDSPAAGHAFVRSRISRHRRPAAGDRPFFTAKRLSVSLDWSKAVARRPEFIVTSVELLDWQMLVEEWRDGHSFPKFGERDNDGNRRAARVGSPRRSGICAPGADSSRTRTTRRRGASSRRTSISTSRTARSYHGGRSLHRRHGHDSGHLPMWANMKARFAIDGSNAADGPHRHRHRRRQTVAVGSVDMSIAGPSRLYARQVARATSRGCARFSCEGAWQLTGDGDFNGTLSSVQGRPRSDRARSRATSPACTQYRFPSLYGSLHWTRNALRGDRTRAPSSTAATRGSTSRSSRSDRPSARRPGSTASYANVDLAAVHRLLRAAGTAVRGPRRGPQRLEWPLGRSAERHGDGSCRRDCRLACEPMTASLAASTRRRSRSHVCTNGDRSRRMPLAAHLPIAGEVTYRFDPEQREAGGRPVRDRAHARRLRGHDRVGRTTRAFSSTSPAATGRKAIRCWPASSPTSARAPARSRSAAAASSTAS